MINSVLAVDEAVSKCDCLLTSADTREGFWVFRAKSNERFADDLELAFHRRARHIAGEVVVEGFSRP
jgi:hypothetical protein